MIGGGVLTQLPKHIIGSQPRLRGYLRGNRTKLPMLCGLIIQSERKSEHARGSQQHQCAPIQRLISDRRRGRRRRFFRYRGSLD